MLSVTDKAISLVLLKTFANLCHTVKPLITVTNFYSLTKKKKKKNLTQEASSCL